MARLCFRCACRVRISYPGQLKQAATEGFPALERFFVDVSSLQETPTPTSKNSINEASQEEEPGQKQI